MVKFSPDEINLIYQFGGENRRETVNNLKSIEPKIVDELTKTIVGSTIHKISVLSEENCSGLISSTKNSKLAERDSSVRKRLADAQERSKIPTASKSKSKHVKRENVIL